MTDKKNFGTHSANIRALRRFEEAVAERAFIGSKDPAMHTAIEDEYHTSRDLLIRRLNR